MTLVAQLDPWIKRYSFTDFHRLVDSGQLENPDRLELIDGIPVQKMTYGYFGGESSHYPQSGSSTIAPQS